MVSFVLTTILAFYLDFRRTNLVDSGAISKKTPTILGLGNIDVGYIFSHQIEKIPDAATRHWVPWLRVLTGLSGLLFAAAGLSMLID